MISLVREISDPSEISDTNEFSENSQQSSENSCDNGVSSDCLAVIVVISHKRGKKSVAAAAVYQSNVNFLCWSPRWIFNKKTQINQYFSQMISAPYWDVLPFFSYNMGAISLCLGFLLCLFANKLHQPGRSVSSSKILTLLSSQNIHSTTRNIFCQPIAPARAQRVIGSNCPFIRQNTHTAVLAHFFEYSQSKLNPAKLVIMFSWMS